MPGRVPPPIVETDRRLTTRLAIPPSARLLRLLALVAAHSGDSPLWFAASIVALFQSSAFWRGWGGRVLVGTLAAGAASTALKWLFRRRRPPGSGVGFYSRFDRHAFPSGHAARSACVAVLLAPLLPGWGEALLCTWVVTVGIARVALQVHFVSDVMGGWAIGALAGLAIQAAL